eukprot:s3469_g2.t1
MDPTWHSSADANPKDLQKTLLVSAFCSQKSVTHATKGSLKNFEFGKEALKNNFSQSHLQRQGREKVEKKKAMAKAALRRCGSMATMQILDERIPRLQHRRGLRSAAFVGNAGAAT